VNQNAFSTLSHPAESDHVRPRREILFVINPISGTQSKSKLVALIEKTIECDQLDSHVAFTEYAGHATELARVAVNQAYDYVVAVGGDGTMNEVARALVDTDTALGIVPVGSGNGLARHLGIPVHVAQSLKRIREEKVVQIDSCTLNDIPFFCTAGVGFDAHVGYVFAQGKKRGFRTYVQTTLQEFFRYKPASYQICIEGKTRDQRAFGITFANASQYGNNAYIAPQADIQDGKMEVCLIQPFPAHAFLELGTRLFNKTLHNSRYVEINQVREATLQGNGPLRIHLDGESYETGDTLNVKIKPRSLKVLV
jgi:YegS/Rv2252/BmrU family lipid kinase